MKLQRRTTYPRPTGPKQTPTTRTRANVFRVEAESHHNGGEYYFDPNDDEDRTSHSAIRTHERHGDGLVLLRHDGVL